MTRPANNGWTSHGHAIPGVTTAGPRPNRVYRCGGTMLCGKCKTEAMAAAKAPSAEATTPLIKNKTGKPEPILTAVEWATIAGVPKTMTAITVTTSAEFEDMDAAYDAAVTQALTKSSGAPLAYEGCKQYMAPDKYKGGYTTGYAWTFTPLGR